MVKLLLLSFLIKEPLHGYAITQLLKNGNYEKWAKILPNSIYNGLNKLERDSFIRIKGTESAGHRIRCIYEITDNGKREYLKLLEEGLNSFKNTIPNDLYILLTLLDDLDREKILEIINKKIATISEEIENWELGRKKKTENSLYKDAMNMIFDNGLSHLGADLKLLCYIKENVDHILYILKESKDAI